MKNISAVNAGMLVVCICMALARQEYEVAMFAAIATAGWFGWWMEERGKW